MGGVVTGTGVPYLSGEVIFNNNNGTIGDIYVGGGGNIGPGPGYYLYFSYTFLFTIPNDFWGRLGSRR